MLKLASMDSSVFDLFVLCMCASNGRFTSSQCILSIVGHCVRFIQNDEFETFRKNGFGRRKV